MVIPEPAANLPSADPTIGKTLDNDSVVSLASYPPDGSPPHRAERYRLAEPQHGAAAAASGVSGRTWELGRESTYFDVALAELLSHLGSRSDLCAVIEADLVDGAFRNALPSDRVQLLSDPQDRREAESALSWCGQFARDGGRAFVILTERRIENLFGQLRASLFGACANATLIVVPEEPIPAGDRPQRPILAFLRLLPVAAIICPKDGWELRQVFGLAGTHAGSTVIRIPRGKLPAVRFPDFAEEIEFGRAEVLEEGHEILLLALGSLAAPAVQAAEILSRQGISVGVVNARFVEPLDRSLIGELAAQCRGVVTLEEEAASGGFGTAVLELLADLGISTPVTVSGAVGFDGAAGMDDTVDWIVKQAVRLVDRANGTDPHAPDPRVQGRNGVRNAGEIDLFGFSREALQREQDSVRDHKLSPQVEEFYQIYSQVGFRKRFLWQWCEQGSELTTLPCVKPELFRHVNDTKLLSMILCVLLDDVADLGGRAAFLELLLRVVDGDARPDLAGCDPEERRYAEVTSELTDIWYSRLASYPSYETFRHLLRYDQVQYYNAMRYSHMLNRNLWAMNQVEHDLYLPHAMDMMSFATTDLMATVDFPLEELGRLREALWHLQCMGRVGNLLSTWRREIHQRDFASGVFARAVIEGDLSVQQLHPDNYGEIEAAIVNGGHELYYFGRWKYHRECFLAKARYVRAVDLRQLIEANDRLFLMHLGGRGLI